MAKEIIMPRQGQSVETCLILEWKKQEGDEVKAGDVICVVETDKASFDIEAPEDGVLLKTFFKEGDDVPVLTGIAVIGNRGEDISSFLEVKALSEPDLLRPEEIALSTARAKRNIRISPRARKLAAEKSADCSDITGTGPGGRIIVRDIENALGLGLGQGLGQGEKKRPFAVSSVTAPLSGTADFPGHVEEIEVKGVRKLISERMLSSLQTTAQYTLNISARAGGLLRYRAELKQSPEELDLKTITITDMILFAVSRLLTRYKAINAHYLGEKILQFQHVHLGLAVDTPRGLMVPVLRFADRLSLKEISEEAKRLSASCFKGRITAEELNGATFTLTNLGSLGVESFTPILNPPQVGILGVGSIQLKPVQKEERVEFVRSILLSLTLNHQVVDGALAARFLRDLAQALEQLNLYLAV